VVVIAGSAVVAACSTTGAGPTDATSSGTPGQSVAASASAAEPSAAASASTSTSGGGRGDYSYEDPASDAPAASTAAGSGPVAVNAATGPLGIYLTGADGLTLYTFKPDGTNASTCDSGCAEAWPPFTIEPGVELAPGDGVKGVLTTFSRTEGTLQVAYNGAPLYYFANDTVPGDTNGQGLGDNWFVAEP
jgi:predicted lipoprotein with Yx(FWY)xxD motif